MNSFMEIIHLHVQKYSGNGVLIFRSYKTLPLTDIDTDLKTNVSYFQI